MSTIKQIIKNTASGWLSIILKSAVNLVTIPFLLKALGANGYGLIAILGTIVGLSVVIDLGLRSALGQTLAERLAKTDMSGYSKIITTALILYLFISFIFVTVIYLLTPALVQVLNIPDSANMLAVEVIRFYGAPAIFISFLTPVFSAALQSKFRFDIVNNLQTITSVLGGLSIILLIKLIDFEIIHWVVVTLSFQVTMLFLLIWFFKKEFPEFKVSKKNISFKEIKPLFNLGGYMYLIQLSNTVSNQSNPLIISAFNNIKLVGLYQPALNLSQAITPIVMTLTSQLYPAVTKSHFSGDKNSVNKIFILGTKYTLLLGSLVSAGIFFFAEPFAKLWLYSSIGEDYLTVSKVIQVFVFVDLLTYASGTQWPILLGMRKLKYLTKLLIFTAVFDILISIYLVGYRDYGIIGVLYGTIASKLLRTYFLNKYILGLLSISLKDYLKSTLIRPLLCLALTCVTASLIVNNYSSDTWGEFMMLISCTSVLWFLYVLFFGLDKRERSLIMQGKLKNLAI